MQTTGDIPRESDEHVIESWRNAHRQSSIHDVVGDQTRIGCISTVKYLQLSTRFRLFVHLQHIQCNTLSKFCLKPLQAEKICYLKSLLSVVLNTIGTQYEKDLILEKQQSWLLLL